MDFKVERIEIPEDCNIILGQTHFIKTAEGYKVVDINCNPGMYYDLIREHKVAVIPGTTRNLGAGTSRAAMRSVLS